MGTCGIDRDELEVGEEDECRGGGAGEARPTSAGEKVGVMNGDMGAVMGNRVFSLCLSSEVSVARWIVWAVGHCYC